MRQWWMRLIARKRHLRITPMPFPALIHGAIALLILGLSAVASPDRDRPNIIVFLVDDMGIMDTSVPFLTDEEGNPKAYPLNSFYRTPHMERLAAQGVRFNNFCAMSVCSPTRISMMTGQNAARHGTTNWINPDSNNRGPNGPPDWNWKGLQPGDVTLASVLRASGYRTMHVGKAHFAPRATPGSDPSTLGFEVNIAGASFGAPGSYFGADDYGNKGNRRSHAVPHLEKHHGTETFLTEALTQETLPRLSEWAGGDRPFFLHFSHYAVHSPFQSDPRFAANYAQSNQPKAAQAFATLVEGIDKSLGDVLNHLGAIGVAERTLLIFLGDNGSDAPLGHQHSVACAAPLRGKKGAHYEGGMRVPFLVAWAKPDPTHPIQKRFPIAQGAIQSQIASVEDIFPTLLGLAGIAVPEGHTVDGQRLDTLLTGQPDAERAQRFLMHYPHGPHRSNYWSSLREGEWKVIYHYLPGKGDGDTPEQYELYHLARDPFEQQNLASEKPDMLASLMNRLVDELERHGALYPKAPGTQEPLKPIVPVL